MSTPAHDLGPHPDDTVKVPHLVMALLFLGTVATWALLASGVLDADALPYLAPALLVAAGLAGLGALAAGGRRARRRRSDDVAPPREERLDDQGPGTMDDHPAPTPTRRLEQDPTDGEPTAPLFRPEDHR